MAVPNDALTTRQLVKDYLGIATGDTTYDTVIDELINYATAFIKNYTGGRNFLATDYVDMYDTYRGRRKIFLRQFPVNTVTKVEYRSGVPTAVIWLVYDPNSYLVYLKSGYIHFYGQLPQVSLGLQVTYNAGYLIDFNNPFDPTKHTLPADLTMVANEIIAKIYNTRKSAGILQETTEGQSISYSFKARELDDHSANILASYKAYRIAG